MRKKTDAKRHDPAVTENCRIPVSQSEPAPGKPFDLKSPEVYINRELSWLEFNRRVLEEAQDILSPLMEKLKFLCIFSSNLDEFFMIRVGNLARVHYAGLNEIDPTGLNAEAQLTAISDKVRDLIQEQYRCLEESVLPALEKDGIRIFSFKQLMKQEALRLREYFLKQVLPVLTPLAVDAGHPFPFIGNLKLNLLVMFESSDVKNHQMPCAFVEVPSVLPRLLPVDAHGTKHAYLLLEDLIREHLDLMFPGMRAQECVAFRITRNLDYDLHENEVMDLLQSVEAELRDRSNQIAVRAEIQHGVSNTLVEFLCNHLQLQPRDVFLIHGPLNICQLMPLYDLKTDPSHYDPPFNPRIPPRLASGRDIFSVIRQGDILLHHPFDSFAVVTDFLNAAADDPDVLAIKQTLYRTGKDSPVIASLIRAAENGKQVTAVMELKARFDEQSNIEWSKKMRDAGINLVYGFVNWKVHAKATLVVRREGDLLKRYVHLSTGNYNTSTARIYTDLGILTDSPEFGHDVSSLFNVITGFNSWTGRDLFAPTTVTSMFTKLILAPVNMHEQLIRLIQKETERAQNGKPARIIAKMNALTESHLIRALYKASQAGVRIDLIVRGMCCLRPGLPGISENISVISVLDRFLEHSRIYCFFNDGDPIVLSGSADWMPRNLFRRVEVLYPIESPQLKTRIMSILVDVYLRDNIKARNQKSDGHYERIKHNPQDKCIRSQSRLIEIARKGGIKSAPYDEIVRKVKSKKKAGR